jgi:hypothetical protein
MISATGYRAPLILGACGIASLWLWHGRASEPVPRSVVPPVVPAPAPQPRFPTRAVPCVGDDVELLANGAIPVLCSSAGCLSIDPETGDVTTATRPAAVAISPASVREGSICDDHSCKHLGPKLAAAVVHAAQIDATADLAAVVIDRVTAWNVATDRPLRFPTPARARNGDIAVAGRFLAVGQIHLEEGEWRSTSLFDARGQLTQGGLDGDARIAPVADRLVLIGMWGEIAVISAKTGKVTDHAQVGTSPVWLFDPPIVALPREHGGGFAVLRRGWHTEVVSLSTYSVVGDYLLAWLDEQLPICTPGIDTDVWHAGKRPPVHRQP